MFFEKLTYLSKPILWTSFFLGLILSWSVLSGDSVGRVNLLYLIILYVIVPCFSLVYSVISYFYSPSQYSSLSTLLVFFTQNNNFLFTNYKQQYLRFQQSEFHKIIFFYFSQLAAMSFSVASLLVLFVLLFATDVHFIWRSTLLNSEQIFAFLELISKPWLFWSDAQPNLELITNSQDNRLSNEMVGQSSTLSNNWWQFVLATQIFYAFLMRFIFVVLIRLRFNGRQLKNKSIETITTNVSNSAISKKSILNESSPSVGQFNLTEMSRDDIKQDYAVNNWANISLDHIEKITSNLTGLNISIINSGPCATDSERLIAERWRQVQLIVVKSWEPPLAELSDFMLNSVGFILPLDIKNDVIVIATDFHLQEWYRFVENHAQWELLLIPKLLVESSGGAGNNKPNENDG